MQAFLLHQQENTHNLAALYQVQNLKQSLLSSCTGKEKEDWEKEHKLQNDSVLLTGMDRKEEVVSWHQLTNALVGQ